MRRSGSPIVAGNGVAAPSGPYRFCPYCTAALETRRIPAPEGPERRVCSACGFIQWGNSKPTAGGIVVDGRGRILLGRRGVEPYIGWWDLPGGFLEPGEHPEAGVIRELYEETGLVVTVEAFVGVYMDVYGDGASGSGDSLLNFYYVCRTLHGSAQAADDVTALEWFAPDSLPEQIAFPDSSKKAVADWQARHAVAK